MRLLLVLAHPLEDSFAAAVAATARDALLANGHEVDWLDLYREDFDPRLSPSERAGYFTEPYDTVPVAPLVERLKAAEGLVLVFPTWWFGVPAILKGWFDRVLAPGVAFSPERSGGRITPRLTHIRVLHALTTTGSPWWVVELVVGGPVRRVLKHGLGALCARDVRFRMISLHNMDRATAAQRTAHLERVRRTMAKIR